MLCLLFVPFYSLYWWYANGNYVKEAMLERDHKVAPSGVMYLVLNFFGLGILASAIMQDSFNNLKGEDIIERRPQEM